MDQRNDILNKLNKSFVDQEIPIQLSEEQFIDSKLVKEFQDITFIGSGGFGTVLAATKKQFDKGRYAFKIIPAVKNDKKIMEEINHLSSLQHDNVVKYYNAWEEPATLSLNNFNTTPQLRSHGNTSSSDNIVFERSAGKNKVNKIPSYKLLNITQSSSETSPDDPSESYEDDYEEEYIYDESMTPKLLYIQQEFCVKTLRHLIDDFTLKKDIDLAWNILLQISNGMWFIHKNNVMHRDLKPENIFIQCKIGQYQAKIGDFGLATMVAPKSATKNLHAFDKLHSQNVGTGYYVAPEVKETNNYDYSCDIYSLGIVAFEIFYRPFKSEFEKIELFEKMLPKLDDELIIFPSDFGYGENKRMVKGIIGMALRANPNDRIDIFSLLNLVNDVIKFKELFGWDSYCDKISKRFCTTGETSERGMNDRSYFEEKGGSSYQIIVGKIMTGLTHILNTFGMNELPGHFEVKPQSSYDRKRYFDFERFGYQIVKYSSNPEINTVSKNLRYFGFGTVENQYITHSDNYGVVDFIAPVNYASHLGAEILFLMAKIRNELVSLSSFENCIFRIGHAGILKAICFLYKCPLDELSYLLGQAFMADAYDILKTKLEELFKENGIKKEVIDNILEMMKPVDNFTAFKEKLLFLNKGYITSGIITNALSEIEETIEKFQLFYGINDINGPFRFSLSFDARLIYRPKFFCDGLCYSLQYVIPDDNVKHTVLAGGRYDTFFNSKRQHKKSSSPLCAFGLNIFIEALASLQRTMVFPQQNVAPFRIVIYPDKYEIAATQIKTKLHALNYSPSIYYGLNVSIEELLDYQKSQNYDFLLSVIDEENVVSYNRNRVPEKFKKNELDQQFPLFHKTQQASTFKKKITHNKSTIISEEKAIVEKNLGNEAYKKRDFVSAHRHYDAAIALSPNNCIFYSNKAAVFFEEEKYNECIDVCLKALQIGAAADVECKFIAKLKKRIGNAFLKLEKEEIAIYWYKESSSIYHDPDLTNKLEKLLAQVKK